MSGYAAVRGCYSRQTARGTAVWAKGCLRRAARANLGCTIALLDVAGPRTTIRPTVGLTLPHVDHPQLSGIRLVPGDLFDRCAAAAVLILASPPVAAIGAMIRLHDRGPALFTQARIGKDGRVFRTYKFRTIDGTLVRTTSQIQHDCLPETDNCVCRQTCRGVIKVRSARVSV